MYYLYVLIKCFFKASILSAIEIVYYAEANRGWKLFLLTASCDEQPPFLISNTSNNLQETHIQPALERS